jgi:hypothetical protein
MDVVHIHTELVLSSSRAYSYELLRAPPTLPSSDRVPSILSSAHYHIFFRPIPFLSLSVSFESYPLGLYSVMSAINMVRSMRDLLCSSHVERARLPATSERKVSCRAAAIVLVRPSGKEQLMRTTRRGVFVHPLIRFRMSRCRVALSSRALCHDAALVAAGCGGHRKGNMNGIWWDLGVVQTERERPWLQDVTGARGMIQYHVRRLFIAGTLLAQVSQWYRSGTAVVSRTYAGGCDLWRTALNLL